MKRVILLMIAFCSMLTACEHTFVDDLFTIHDEIDKLKQVDEEFQQRINGINDYITSIQTIVEIVSAGFHIESYVPIVENGQEIGYIFRFTNGKEIVINHGKNGQGGHSPLLGVQLIDGYYYWTLDGQILLDGQGNKIPAVSQTFTTPQVTIRNGYWYLSYDGGQTWKILGRATGDDGPDGEDGIEHFIRITTNDSGEVVFVLADGTSLTVPRKTEIHLMLDTGEDLTGIGEKETIEIGYTLSNYTDNTVIGVSSDGFYKAMVHPDDNSSGYISITCPRTYADGFVNVVVYDRAGIVDMQVIRFFEKRISFADGTEYTVSADGGIVTIPFLVNFDYHIEVDPDAASWISLIKTRAGEVVSGNIEAQVSANDGVSRTGILYVYPDNSSRPFAVLYITQSSSLCQVDIGSFVVSYEGGTVISRITTGHGVFAVVDENDQAWIKAEVLPQGGDLYVVALTVEPNPSSESRATTVDVLFSDRTTLQAELKVVQQGRNVDLEYAMIFTVNPNFSNDFTAYLPIDIDSDYDCFVDWGDGTGDHLTSEDDYSVFPEELRNIHHRYEGITIGKNYEVVVTGTVTSLCSDRIPRAFRSSVTEVKQWGKTGLISMERALNGFTGLTTLRLDETGAFSEVTSFLDAFSDCPRLTTVSEHLFDFAGKAESFYGTFSNCSSLIIIPENLFSHCVNTTDFSFTFSHCTALVSIPDRLFDHCVSVIRFSSTFSQCYALTSVPEAIFANNPSVVDFSWVFSECRSLQEIPAGLFLNNKEVTSFSYSFQACSALTEIPASLLDNQRKITNCQWMFNGCGNVRSESPYTWIDGQKVHLYERINYPDYFVTPIHHDYCFASCGRMADSSLFPESWTSNRY